MFFGKLCTFGTLLDQGPGGDDGSGDDGSGDDRSGDGGSRDNGTRDDGLLSRAKPSNLC